MQAQVHFYLLNYDFSQEYADANHNGNESPDNRQFDWEDELAIKKLSSNYTTVKHSTYVLRGFRNDKPFQEEIENMFLISFMTEDGEGLAIGCSHEILESYKIEELDEGLLIAVFLKSDEPLSNPTPGIYIAAKRFPESLMNA